MIMLRMRSGLESVLVVFIVSVSINIKSANAQIRNSLGDVMLRFYFVQYIFVLVIYKGGGGGYINEAYNIIKSFISIECHL